MALRTPSPSSSPAPAPETASDNSPRPSRRSLLMLTGGALAGALVLLFGAILPAEYNIDPLGVGRMTGLSRLWAPREVAFVPGADQARPAHSQTTAFRTDVIEIPLAIGGDMAREDQVEWKVRMREGDVLVYGWAAKGAPDDEFYFDFHGHTLTGGEAREMVVTSYEESMGAARNGSLTAPFEGIHGWFFQNQTEHPMVVEVRIAGFYELIPPGQEGKEAGIQPVARP